MEKSKVYFIKDISPENVIKAYEALGIELKGNVAVKLHSGEPGNQNFLRPDFMKPAVDHVGGTIVECNTAYDGGRDTTERHKKTMQLHGWVEIADVDIMDAEGEMTIPVAGGKHLDVNYVGKTLPEYDSMLVLSHFKGHPMGGYGGALKQLSIGCASSDGKAWIHSGGTWKTQDGLWSNTCEQDTFLAAMADAASSVTDLFAGRAAYINIVCNLSVDCDCCAVAEDPCMRDIGILASLDPVALDRACLDLIEHSDDPGREHFLERVYSRHGQRTIDFAAALGVGSVDYTLTTVD